MNNEFIQSLRQISEEKEIDVEVVLDAVEVALATACKKN